MALSIKGYNENSGGFYTAPNGFAFYIAFWYQYPESMKLPEREKLRGTDKSGKVFKTSI